MNINEVEVYHKLINEENYSKVEASNVINELKNIDLSLVPIYEAWFNKTSYPQIEIEGYSYNWFITQLELKPIAAILSLDWLIKDPNMAKELLKKGIR